MITIYGEGRGFRVIWLLEEMGLPYQLVDIDLLKGVEHCPEFLAINPAGFIPAMVDGDVRMVESVAIMQYLLAAYAPTPLAVLPSDPTYPRFLQFLLMGETAISSSMFYEGNYRRLVPEGDRSSRWEGFMRYQFESRVDLIRRQVEQTPYLAGDRFTAADVSVVYALDNARRTAGITHEGALGDYIARCLDRDGYRRTMEACPAIRGWEEGLKAKG
jgi:glutathione S-transferase